ncbi:unnamed protein product [Cylicocyclus nassatus]|uniref:Uncharacterized protein n=1 Tax=Cylicocyclus nassatus TaxID=53992 RepID=A0AA36DUT1_CYLNA|nr:unnamed protein product [Cylicocyclus nassatus]
MALKNLDTYESRTSSAGITMAVLSIACSFGVIIFAMSDYNFVPKQMYCTAVTPETLFKVSLSSIITVVLEAFTIICFFCVYYANSKQR